MADFKKCKHCTEKDTSKMSVEELNEYYKQTSLREKEHIFKEILMIEGVNFFIIALVALESINIFIAMFILLACSIRITFLIGKYSVLEFISDICDIVETAVDKAFEKAFKEEGKK